MLPLSAYCGIVRARVRRQSGAGPTMLRTTTVADLRRGSRGVRLCRTRRRDPAREWHVCQEVG
eukprot:7119499-Pyramimonas_sp.AAC.1